MSTSSHNNLNSSDKPYNNITGDVDEASISADGATCTFPRGAPRKRAAKTPNST